MKACFLNAIFMVVFPYFWNMSGKIDLSFTPLGKISEEVKAQVRESTPAPAEFKNAEKEPEVEPEPEPAEEPEAEEEAEQE